MVVYVNVYFRRFPSLRAVVYICNFARKIADLRARQMKLFFVEE